MTLMGIALTAFAIATRLIAARRGITDGIIHRPFSSPYQSAPAARDGR